MLEPLNSTEIPDMKPSDSALHQYWETAEVAGYICSKQIPDSLLPQAASLAAGVTAECRQRGADEKLQVRCS